MPTSPGYTLGRFMATQGSQGEKQPLYNERDAQIRRTAADTLHPAGIRPEFRHAAADGPEAAKYAKQDAKAREVLQNLLLVLQHGLKSYGPEAEEQFERDETDVIRALAHGGRVNNGSHGHMLLVLTQPTADRDGSLLVGIETIAPGADSPVGYQHDFRSTEATANPESVLHGHKADKPAAERLVDLSELGGGDWRAFLDEVRRHWLSRLEQTEDGSAERREMYERLVGRRRDFPRPGS